MSKNFELLQQFGKDDFFHLPDESVPLPQQSPAALLLRKDPPDAEIAKLVQRLFSKGNLDDGPKVISFSGISRGDRSSWICACAGEVLAAQVDASVCIVDANLWSPQLHVHVNTTNQIGLVDALANEDPIRDFARPFSSGNLSLISAGLMKPGLHFSVERYRMRFKELRDAFEYILISAPPLTRETEATSVGKLADGIILIVDANQSRREVVRRAKEHLESSHVHLLGAVLDQRTFPIPDFLYRKL